jgi:hypothetical protein
MQIKVLEQNHSIIQAYTFDHQGLNYQQIDCTYYNKIIKKTSVHVDITPFLTFIV